MRLFIALEMDPDPQAALAGRVQALRQKLGRSVSWTRPENLHITLRFLGEMAPKPVVAALAGVREDAFQFRPERWGAFPSTGSPRVLWAGIDPKGENEAGRLAKAVEHRLHSIGIEPEPKPFRAHITVGRAKEKIAELVTVLESVPLKDIGASSPKRFVLMESRLGPGGSQYSVVAEFPLGQGR